MMSHQQKQFPQKSEQQEGEEGEEGEHETCTNLKRPPLREGPNSDLNSPCFTSHTYGKL